MDIKKNYYEIMGVSEDASEKDIKTAYRRLARKFHPDISKEPNAEERFKEVGEAYDTLKDPAKRKEYDEYRKYGAQAGSQHHWQNTQESPYQYQGQFDEDLFESLFGHARGQQRPRSGQDFYGKIDISLEEAFTGTVKTIQIPVQTEHEVSLQTLKVKIPAGVKSGQQVRLAGQGGMGHHGGPRGDVYITVQVEKHPLFEVMDNDVYLTLPITPWEAALGTKITVPTLGGKIDMKIPPNSQGGQKLRLKDRGLPGKKPGDQFILLKIITPPATSAEATELYKKMAEVMPFNPRNNLGV